MRTSILAAALAATVAMAPALAHQGPYAGPTSPVHGSMMGPGMMMGPGTMWGGSHVEGRLAFLKAELAITEAQAPQWAGFADALRIAADRTAGAPAWQGTGQEMMGPGPMMGHGPMTGQGGIGRSGTAVSGMAPLSVPERLAQMEAALTARMAALQSLKDPTERLYAVLTHAQKQVADQLLLGPMGIMGAM